MNKNSKIPNYIYYFNEAKFKSINNSEKKTEDCIKTLNTVYQTGPINTVSFSAFRAQNINLFNAYQNSGVINLAVICNCS